MKHRKRTYRNTLSILAGSALLLLNVYASLAQLSPSLYSYPQNHLPWYTIESDHFKVHFQKGSSRPAQIASRIAEEIYPHITNLYNLEPDSRINIVINDRLDYSNGAAYFFDNQIEIWLPALDTPFRGTHGWLRNVITHEFIHIIQLQAAMKRTSRVPAIYFQWLSYEEVRRPDVLYGFPNGVLTYPFASVSVPAWLAEGTAQYQHSGWFYDTWDSHRDMLLRTSILNDTYLDFDEMGFLTSKTSLEREKAYNQGFAFTSYLVDRFGENFLPDVSKALSQKGIFTADEAMEISTGIPGRKIFEEWISNRKVFYKNSIASIVESPTATLEDRGFLNLHPTLSPDGTMLAYLSNKSWKESGISLYIRNRENLKTSTAVINLGVPTDKHPFSCGYMQKPVIDQIRSSFSFSPDGKKMVFSRNKVNKLGESYNDLFILNLHSEKERRLTNSARLHDPAWSPDGGKIAAVRQHDGSTNLVLVDTLDGTQKMLTTFKNGEQVYTPVWHPDGNTIYFAFADDKFRNIYRYNLKAETVESVLSNPYIDQRDPLVSPDGQYLYYASDESGIFNIYRTPVEGGEITKLTNVLGGAFMPTLSPDGEIIFSEYKKGGYKISSITFDGVLPHNFSGRYNPPLPASLMAPEDTATTTLSMDYDDSDLSSFSESMYERADATEISFSIETENSTNKRTFYPYEETFTKLSFYPVVRFDNYSKLNGSNGQLLRDGKLGLFGENLYRDLKTGTYFSSREVIDRLSIFGGALFGVGSLPADGIGDYFSPSRLSDLDRDLFLVTEYEGLPFIKKRWSPTVSLEFYNQRRNVRDGLSIEEFPCTACLPDTLNTDIAYNIWELDLFLRSKINDYNIIEIGGGYTPYRVQTDAFFSNELQQFIPSSSVEYFRGSKFSVSHAYENFIPYLSSDIAPIGLRTFLKYGYEPGKLLEDYEIQDGTLIPVYKSSKNHSVEFNSRYGFKIGPKSSGQLYGRFFSYLNQPDDFFYLDYIGGFTGMRSYPFFALGGNTTAFAQFSYIFPLITDIHQQAGRHTLDKLYLRLFAEAGNGWNNSISSANFIKTGIGTEIRFAFNSYYLFPLKLFVSSAYGLNQFDVQLPLEFLTGNESGRVSYGEELIFHFGLTFDFNVLNND